MKRLVTVVIPASRLAGSVLLSSSDTEISVADTSIPTSEAASTISKASNSSASATIAITMTGVFDG